MGSTPSKGEVKSDKSAMQAVESGLSEEERVAKDKLVAKIEK